MDLHIHTVLSPCGGENMTPQKIVERAKEKGLNGIAICDHNSAENVRAVRLAGEKRGVKVLGGMEITSREEVHLLALFDDEEKLMKLQKIIYQNLPGVNQPEIFGSQLLMDEEDKILGEDEHLLIGSSLLSLSELVELIHSFSGLAIASHIDRETFGIIGQLGFIPKELPLDALEISPRISFDSARKTLPLGDFPVITYSDAHYLEDIGKSSTIFWIKELNLEELKKAFLGKEGRKVYPG